MLNYFDFFFVVIIIPSDFPMYRKVLLPRDQIEIILAFIMEEIDDR